MQSAEKLLHQILERTGNRRAIEVVKSSGWYVTLTDEFEFVAEGRGKTLQAAIADLVSQLS